MNAPTARQSRPALTVPLDRAIERGIPHSGWCPKGRLAGPSGRE